jgi:hypothetical protein
VSPEPIPNLSAGQLLTVSLINDIIDAVNELRGVGRNMDAVIGELLGGDQ